MPNEMNLQELIFLINLKKEDQKNIRNSLKN